jgi:hypothetical protein
MNIVSVLNKLKSVNMVSSQKEVIEVFNDCFYKFGISLLLLQDDEKFNDIVDTLAVNKIPLQKSNGIYNLRIFAVELDKLNYIISEYNAIGEIDFLRHHVEYITEEKNVMTILENMKKYQSENVSYKNGHEYNIGMLLNKQVTENKEVNDVNEYLKTIMKDPSIVDKVINNTPNGGEEDFNIALTLQKVENKICEEYLFPEDDGWKIIINEKGVNGFQSIKDTINLITKLNIPITYEDAFIFVLFYKTNLSVEEIKEVIDYLTKKGGM